MTTAQKKGAANAKPPSNTVLRQCWIEYVTALELAVISNSYLTLASAGKTFVPASASYRPQLFHVPEGQRSLVLCQPSIDGL